MRSVLALAVLGLLPLPGAPASASPIRFEFVAVVSDVFSGPLSVGQTVTGSYVFDRSLPPDPQYPTDPQIVTEATIDLPAGTVTQPKESEFSFSFIRVRDDGPNGDLYYVDFEEVGLQLLLTLEDPSGEALNSSEVPIVPPDLALFETAFINVQTDLGGDYYSFLANLTALTVPEASSASLGLAGLLVALAARRMRST